MLSYEFKKDIQSIRQDLIRFEIYHSVQNTCNPALLIFKQMKIGFRFFIIDGKLIRIHNNDIEKNEWKKLENERLKAESSIFTQGTD